ncbi:MAG TPA: M35 family metallo-endopeptidase [Acetobacteraceae bacterium]|nr:M35 family metallo-endopeptidase [Acetobacteraceae bacterium]
MSRGRVAAIGAFALRSSRIEFAILGTALAVCCGNAANAQPENSPTYHYQVSVGDCSEPVCRLPDVKASDIKKLIEGACTQTEKARKLLERLTSRGRQGIESLRAAGVVPPIVKQLNGSKGDTWNAIRVLDILVKTSQRCNDGVSIECEAACKKDVAAWVRPKIGHTIHLCVTEWCSKTADDKSATVLHELTHFGGSTDEANDVTSAYQLANVSNAIIPALAEAYDRMP